MLEEIGAVIEADSEWLWVETSRRSACSHCGVGSAGSCSSSVIAKLFGVKRHRLRLDNSLQARQGQQVVIGIPDRTLVKVSLLAYLLPLLGMLGGAGLAQAVQMSDMAMALLAMIGLFGGLALSGRAGNRGRARQRYAPQLLRLADAPEIEIDTTALMRNRT